MVSNVSCVSTMEASDEGNGRFRKKHAPESKIGAPVSSSHGKVDMRDTQRIIDLRERCLAENHRQVFGDGKFWEGDGSPAMRDCRAHAPPD